MPRGAPDGARRVPSAAPVEPVGPAEPLGPGEPAGTAQLRSQAASGGRWVAVGAVVSNLVAAGVLFVLAALLPPADLGVLALGTAVFVIANTLQDLGLFDVLVFSRSRVQEAAETVLVCWLVGSLVLGGTVLLTSPLLARLFGEPRATVVLAAAGVQLLLFSVAGVPMALRTRALDLRTRALTQMSAVLVGGTTTVVLVLSTDLGLLAMVVGQLTQALLLVTVAWTVGPRAVPRWHGDVARELFAYGRHSFGAAVTTMLQYNVDYLVVARVLGAAALGVYSFSFRVAFLPHAIIALVVASTMFALVCRLDGRERADAVLGYTRTVLLLVTPLAAGLVLFAPAITLLGDVWSDAVPVVRWLGLYVLLTSVATVTVQGLKGVGLPRRAFAVSALHLGVLTVLLLLVTQRGVTEVAVARAAVAGVVAVLGWWWLARAAGIGARASAALLPLPALGVAAMVLATWLLPWTVDARGTTWSSAVPQGLAALAAYVAALAVADRAALRDAVARVRRSG